MNNTNWWEDAFEEDHKIDLDKYREYRENKSTTRRNNSSLYITRYRFEKKHVHVWPPVGDITSLYIPVQIGKQLTKPDKNRIFIKETFENWNRSV